MDGSEPLPRDCAVTLLCVQCCSEFCIFVGSGDLGVRQNYPGANGWCEVSAEHIDALGGTWGYLALEVADECNVTEAGSAALAARGWIEKAVVWPERPVPTEQGLYWLRRAVRADDRKTRKPYLRALKAAAIAEWAFAKRRAG